MPPKANTGAEHPRPNSSTLPGKLVIIAIVFVALAGAGISWFFRYSATHQAVKFWGPEAAVLIRDAPIVTVYHPANFGAADAPAVVAKTPAKEFDITRARGLVYLRNALLEDHNFKWDTVTKEPLATKNDWGLMFADPKAGKSTTIWLSDDFHHVARQGEAEAQSVSVDTVMAKGLREMFGEFSAAAKEAAGEGAKPHAADGAAGASAPSAADVDSIK